MARIRNISDQSRFVPEATPQVVEPDGVAEVPDARLGAFLEQPYFVEADAAPKKPVKKAASNIDSGAQAAEGE